MGNKNIVDEELREKNGQWREIQEKKREGGGIIVEDMNKNLGERQSTIFNPKLNIEEQMNIYKSRKYQSKSLVKVYTVQLSNQNKQSSKFCGNHQLINVITERMVKLWSQLPQLTELQCIYALSQALKGYSFCFQVYGLFNVTDKMIGINQRGQLKVWVNQNFSENHPPNEKTVLQTVSKIDNNPLRNNLSDLQENTEQRDLVKNIIQVIQQKCEHGHFNKDLKARIQKKLIFTECSQALKDYCYRNNLDPINKINTDPTKYYTRTFKETNSQNSNYNNYNQLTPLIQSRFQQSPNGRFIQTSRVTAIINQPYQLFSHQTPSNLPNENPNILIQQPKNNIKFNYISQNPNGK